MTMMGFQKPKRLEAVQGTLSSGYGEFFAQPFEKGFGITLGNALRRVLLSSIEGAAVTAIKIDGVLHEFSSMKGVIEDVINIILNLKRVPFRLDGAEITTLTLDRQGPGEVTAKDIQCPANVECIDPGKHIANLNEEGHLRMEMRLKLGRGYVSAKENMDADLSEGHIPIDSVHSPVTKVNYRVEPVRLAQATDYDKLVLQVWTNGAITPQEAITRASRLLKEHMDLFTLESSDLAEEAAEEAAGGGELDTLLGKNISELALSTRSANSLRKSNINTVRDLVCMPEEEIKNVPNFGKKSFEEIKGILENMGLSFGMEC